ncbi:RHS repeat domain-containing protein [Salinivibrio sp. ML290]|uniref:RHS repeat domain-containing protein n=2 Tax=Salinivibrio TaxID=51366 RepID=UPI001F523CFB|nr:RHS repeat-associated core domain-containing protein [Salinivibrio sp. ML290]
MQQQQATADGQVLQQTEYLYEPGSFRPMAQVTHHEQGSELHYIVTDHAGTPQELCNEQGDIVWRGEQALWGHYHGQSQRHWQRREEAANDSIQCDLRYQGQLEDVESGLYYNVNRYYDADSGQYLSPDPIGFAGGLRPQAYVANPLEWVDPLGLAECGSKNTQKERVKANIEASRKARESSNMGGEPPAPGSRTYEGFMKEHVSPDRETTLHTKSAGFNNNKGNVGGQFKRYGLDSHAGISPHVHQPVRNVSPKTGDIYGTQGTKTSNGGVTSPSKKDIKQLYDHVYNGKYGQ